MKSKAEEYRSNLIEKVAENDEDFLEIVFSGEEFDNQILKDAIKFIPGIITTSFFLRPTERNARCNAEVPLLQTAANFAPV